MDFVTDRVWRRYCVQEGRNDWPQSRGDRRARRRQHMILMSALSPRARDIVRAGRDMNRPTAAHRDRSQSAVRARLGPDFAFDEPTSSTPRPRWQALAGTVA